MTVMLRSPLYMGLYMPGVTKSVAASQDTGGLPVSSISFPAAAAAAEGLNIVLDPLNLLPVLITSFTPSVVQENFDRVRESITDIQVALA